MNSSPQQLWLISDGKAGHLNQLRALANALSKSAPSTVHEITWQPSGLLATLVKYTKLPLFSFPSEKLPHGTAKVILSIGKVGIVGQYLIGKKQPQNHPYRVHLMGAGHLSSAIDLEILMQHDVDDNRVLHNGQCVITLPPSPITPELITNPALPDLGEGRKIALLIGGGNRAFTFGEQEAKIWGRKISEMLKKQNSTLYITPSRRTPKKSLKALLAALGDSRYYCWDETGENPYRAMISMADTVLVTGDSISMQSDVVHARKPLYALPLQTSLFTRLMKHEKKYQKFTKILENDNLAKEFDGVCVPFKLPSDNNPNHQLIDMMRKRIAPCDTTTEMQK